MYATSADWSFDSKPDFPDLDNFIANLKAAGAINWHYVMTSETTARTMIVWPDKETAHKALSIVRDDAEAATAQKITSTCEGNIVAGF